MAKRKDLNTSGPDRNNAGSPAESKEQRLVAFAEQLGWIVGTVQGKAEGWLNSEALTTQISKVRDSASALLDQLRSSDTKSSSKGKVASKVRASATSGANTKRGSSKGRSGGVVDAPGKKHRKPVPSESGATGLPRGQGSRISKLTSHKQNRIQRRG
jgi:hypothetical protein